MAKYVVTEETIKEPFAAAYKKYKDIVPNISDLLKELLKYIHNGKFTNGSPCSIQAHIIEKLLPHKNQNITITDKHKNKIIKFNTDINVYHVYTYKSLSFCGYFAKGKELFPSKLENVKNSPSGEQVYFRLVYIQFQKDCKENSCQMWKYLKVDKK